MGSKTECSYCGDPLQGEELEGPYKDADDNTMCDSCYSDYYEEICPRCCELVPNEELDGEVGRLIYVRAGASMGRERVSPGGYYRVKRWPFFGGSLLGPGSLYPEALELVAVPDAELIELQGSDARCESGGICLVCEREVMATGDLGNREWHQFPEVP